MRITQQMLYDSFLGDAQVALASIFEERAKVSSGKEILAPSDDPSGTARVLGLAREQNRIEMYKQNVESTDGFLGASESALLGISGLLIEVRTLAIQSGDGGLNDDDRFELGERIRDIVDEIFALTNSKFGAQYIFAGTDTTERAYIKREVQGRDVIEYRGNDREIQIDISSGSRVARNVAGSDVFGSGPGLEARLVGVSGARVGEGPSSGRGETSLLVTHGDTVYSGESGVAASPTSGARDTVIGEHTLTITQDADGRRLSLDGGRPVTFDGTETDLEIVGPNGQRVHVDTTQIDPGFQGEETLEASGFLSLDGGLTEVPIDFQADQLITNSETGASLSVDSRDIKMTGRDFVTFSGTLDMFQTLDSLRQLVQEDDPEIVASRTELVASRLRDLDLSHQNVTRGLSEVGGRRARLQAGEVRLSELDATLAKIRSSLEDSDITEAVTKLQQKEIAYQAALQTGSRISRLSLINFI